MYTLTVLYYFSVSIFTLNPSSPGFSGSKSYKAVQQGALVIGVLAGDFMGDGNGDAKMNKNHLVTQLLLKNWSSANLVKVPYH